MSKIVVLGSLPESLINFRWHLLHAMVALGHTVTGCSSGAPTEVVNELAKINVSYRSISLERTGWNPLNDLQSLYELCKLFKELGPDILLSYTVKPVIYGSIAASFVGIPHIYSMITGLGYSFLKSDIKQKMVGLLVRGLYRFSLRGNRKVFFQNRDDINLFKKLHLLHDDHQAVLINGSGVDVNYFSEKPLPSKISFLLIARLIRDKGITEYVSAARILKNKYPEVTFYLVGPFDDNPTSYLKNEVQSWVKEGIIIYLGAMSDVRLAISNSSVYVLPSYREGTPRTVLEAMAMGRPIITTDAPGCRETVIDGRNGFLIPVKNAYALAEAMERFVLQPELTESMGKRSREIAESRFDVFKVNNDILKAMRLIDENPI
jgi:glycosyltransferase involved in cell wall biosynthesis